MSSIWAIQAYWLALALPGFALLWRWDRASLRGGLLAGLARCYLASFALLTPVSVIGHLFHWPLWTLSGAILVAIATASLSLSSDVSWCVRRPRRPSFAAAVGGTLLLLDLVRGARAGTHLGGDAGYHVARVRLLLDLGLNSWDPLVSDLRVDAVYHTNLYHALIASCAQLTHTDPIVAWLQLWPFAKLLTAAGAYQLAYVLFGQRWLGWVAATCTGVWYACYAIVPLPNTLAPVALLPMGLAAGVEALTTKPSYRHAAWLGATALALAQVHALNAAFLVLLVAPCLLAAIVYRRVRKLPGQRQLLACLIATGASAPWLLVPVLPHLEDAMARHAPAVAAAYGGSTVVFEKAPANEKGYKNDYFRKLDNGMSMLDPMELLGPNERNRWGAYALLIAVTLRPRRRQLWGFALLIGTGFAWLVVPPLCTALLAALGAAWAVARLTNICAIAVCALAPAAPFYAIPTRFRSHPVPRVLIAVTAIWLAFSYAQRDGQHQPPWTIPAYLGSATEFRSRINAKVAAERRAFFVANIPPGATVMANPRWEYNLPMHHRCHTLALSAGRGWHGRPDMAERRAAIDEFFDRRTSGERRLELLRKYSIQHIYTSPRLARQIATSLGERSTKIDVSDQDAIVTVRL